MVFILFFIDPPDKRSGAYSRPPKGGLIVANRFQRFAYGRLP